MTQLDYFFNSLIPYAFNPFIPSPSASLSLSHSSLCSLLWVFACLSVCVSLFLSSHCGEACWWHLSSRAIAAVVCGQRVTGRTRKAERVGGRAHLCLQTSGRDFSQRCGTHGFQICCVGVCVGSAVYGRKISRWPRPAASRGVTFIDLRRACTAHARIHRQNKDAQLTQGFGYVSLWRENAPMYTVDHLPCTSRWDTQ